VLSSEGGFILPMKSIIITSHHHPSEIQTDRNSIQNPSSSSASEWFAGCEVMEI
jgi:hypothetical protein